MPEPEAWTMSPNVLSVGQFGFISVTGRNDAFWLAGERSAETIGLRRGQYIPISQRSMETAS